MGFFDKLREVANKAVDSVQSVNDPLPNETAKQYYEIVYGALGSLKVGASYKALKKYVEFYAGQQCDETILQQVLIWFSEPHGSAKIYLGLTEGALRSRANSVVKEKGITPNKVEKIIEINKGLELTPKYRCSFEEACNICYKDVMEAVESVKVLSGNAFSNGIDGIFDNFKDTVGQAQVAKILYMTCREEIINNFKPTYDKVLGIAEDRGVQYFSEAVKNLFTKYEKLFGAQIVEDIIQALVEGSCAEGNEIAEAYLSKKKH